MDKTFEARLAKDVQDYVTQNLPLSTLTDEELENQIEQIVEDKLDGKYCTPKGKAEIVRQIFSTIRGFGLLDTIMNDNSITEVMINGADNIFVEKEGRVVRIPQTFGSEDELKSIIQRIVGLAGREVNQANPIVDTRLPDGSRVNMVLRPIAL